MTTRRLLALFTLLALLSGPIPSPAVAAVSAGSDPGLPAFSQAFSVTGTDARYAGSSLVVAGEGAALNEYDATTGNLVREWPLDAPAIRLSANGVLLALTKNGSLYCFRPESPNGRLALDWQVLRNNGKTFTKDEAMLAALGNKYDSLAANEALVALGNQVYLVSLQTGKVIWQKALQSGAVVRHAYQVAGYSIIQYLSGHSNFITVWSGQEEVTTFPDGGAFVRDDRRNPGTTIYYVVPDSLQINSFDIATREHEAYLLTDDAVSSLSLNDNFVITTYDYSLNWQDEVKSWYSDGATGHTSYPLKEGYLAVSSKSVALLGSDQLSWATELAAGDETTAILDDRDLAGFALKLNKSTIAVYNQAQQYVNSRELTSSQGHIYYWQHATSGPVKLDLNLREYHPYLGLKFAVRYRAEGSTEWTMLEQGLLEDFVTTLSYTDVPAGQVRLTIVPSMTGTVNPELLPGSDAAAHRPLAYGINLLQGLNGSLAAPPLLRSVNPGQAVHDLWNDAGASGLLWQVQTDPSGQVDFLGLENLVPADAAGTVRQTVPLTDKQGQYVQARAGNEGEPQSSLSIWVYRHLITADPRLAPQLSRQPAIAVSLPDASKVDPSQSQMLVDGVKIPLYVNLQTNRVYGVPAKSLPTGAHIVALILRGPAGEDGGAGPLLDWAEWPLEIIGDREAMLWPGKSYSKLNGETVSLDAAPYVDRASSSTMIPFRYVGDVMGAQVNWNNQTKQVTFTLADRTVLLTIGSRTAHVNGQEVTMLTSPTMKNGRTLVPLRFVSEQLGAVVNWDGAKQQITIRVAADPAE